MASLDLSLLPWQEEVMHSNARFKVVAAGRRTGKSYLAAISMIIRALDGKEGKVFYVAPTQGMARDIMWHTIFELAGDIIERSHTNNLEITLAGGNTIFLKGADRPDTLRGVSLKYLVLDEYAFCKPDVFDNILRPALADKQGDMLAIGTPEGRNHFYDMYTGATQWDGWEAFHFTSFDNPLVPKSEIEHARQTLPSYAFHQEFMASFDARTGSLFDPEKFLYHDKGEQRQMATTISLLTLPVLSNRASARQRNATIQPSLSLRFRQMEDGGWKTLSTVNGHWMKRAKRFSTQ